MKLTTTLVALVLGLMLAAPSVHAQPRDAAVGGETPQAVFDTFVKAGNEKNWRQMYSCLTENSGARLLLMFSSFPLMMLEMQAQFAEGEEKAKAEKDLAAYKEMLKSHGLDLEKMAALDSLPDDDEAQQRAIRELLGSVRDRAALFGGIMDFMSKQSDGEAFNMGENVRLGDVRIDGDNATGTIRTVEDGEEQSQPITFKRANNRWFIELPMD